MGDQAKRKDWEDKTLKPALTRKAERSPEFRTASGLPVERIYSPSDIVNLDYDKDLGYPGEFPYTRGVQPTMYRGRLWTMRQYAGFGTAEESNRRYRYLLSQGQTGLSVAFDLPTQMGYDADHPLAQGEVGKVGVSICSIRDMEILLDQIPLAEVSTSMTINATAPILLALYVAVARQRGMSDSTLSGTVQNDILKEYIARGTYIYPVAQSMRLCGDVIDFCSREMPKWNPISISGYHIREAGSTAPQEVAFTMANGIAYVEEVQRRGIDIETFAPQLAFFFNAHSDFFEEVAKFRVARRLWAHIVKERFGAKNSQSMMLRFHTQTAGSTLTAQQPDNNVVRVALQALSAVLGGTQSLHTNALDEALALPTQDTARLALRTQQVIAFETGVASTVDPLAGSYFIESLTREIEISARHYLEQIDALGGPLVAIEAQYPQGEIEEAAYRWQLQIDSGERVVVGVNRFQIEEEQQPEIMQMDRSLQARQIEALRTLRGERDNNEVAAQLARLETAARSDTNLMPYIITCVEKLCTLGEISDVLRRVFGTYDAGR